MESIYGGLVKGALYKEAVFRAGLTIMEFFL